MGLSNENVVPKILAKIKIFVLTRAELLFKVCYEIPCIGWNTADGNHFFKPLSDFPFRTAVVSMLWRVIWPGFLILDKNDTIRQLSISFCQIDVEISKATLKCCNVIELRQIV